MCTYGRPTHARQILFASNGILHTLSYNREIAPTMSFTEPLGPVLGDVHSNEYCALNAFKLAELNLLTFVSRPL